MVITMVQIRRGAVAQQTACGMSETSSNIDTGTFQMVDWDPPTIIKSNGHASLSASRLTDAAALYATILLSTL